MIERSKSSILSLIFGTANMGGGGWGTLVVGNFLWEAVLSNSICNVIQSKYMVSGPKTIISVLTKFKHRRNWGSYFSKYFKNIPSLPISLPETACLQVKSRKCYYNKQEGDRGRSLFSSDLLLISTEYLLKEQKGFLCYIWNQNENETGFCAHLVFL